MADDDQVVNLECDDGSVTANRDELSLASPYFRAMFTDGFTEQNQKVIRLHSVSQSDLKILLKVDDSGGGGRWSPSQLSDSQQLLSVLTTAGMLQFDAVKAKCCQHIEEILSPDNCLLFLAYCDLLSEKRLYRNGNHTSYAAC